MAQNSTWLQMSYDNSQQFEQYLERNEVSEILKEVGLQRRERQTIVPHVRIFLGSCKMGIANVRAI